MQEQAEAADGTARPGGDGEHDGHDADARFAQWRGRVLVPALVATGLAAVLLRFVSDFPLWPDEAFLVLNFAHRDLAGILRPLDHYQVAPPGYLLLGQAIVETVGLRPLALRLPSLLAAIAAVLWFHRLCRRELPAEAAALSTGFLACSYWVVRHGSEVKPYAIDLLIAVAMLDLVLRWRRRPAPGTLAGLAGLMALGFAWSFSSVFVGGGVVLFLASLAFVPGDAASRSPATTARRLAIAAGLGVLLVASFAAITVLHTSLRPEEDAAWMREYWQRAFPPFDRPAMIPVWLVGMLAGEMSAHPAGGRDWGSSATFLLMIVGAIATRRRDPGLLLLLLAPVGLTLVAACLERYPFGAPTRAQMHLAPAVCLLAGTGLAGLLDALARRGDDSPAGRRRGLAVAGGVLLLVPVIGGVHDLVAGAKNPTDAQLRDLARALHGPWSASSTTTVLSLREDLRESFTPRWDHHQGLQQSWRCNVHAARVAVGPPLWPPAHEEAAAGTVLVTVFRIDGRVDERLRSNWIESFSTEHGLVFAGTLRLSVPDLDKHGAVKRTDEIEVLRFEPAPAGAVAAGDPQADPADARVAPAGDHRR